MQNSFDFVLALPEILLLILAAGVLLFDAFNKSEGRHSTFALSQLSLVIVSLVIFWQWANGIMGTSFGGLFRVDALALFVKLLSVIAVIVTLLYGRQYAEDRGMLVRGGELYTLTMFALLGQFLMISASHLLMVYLGVELLSFSLYALVALRRENAKVTEAAMKYFILGALASGVMLYGLSMVYGATGSLHLNTIGQTIASGEVLRLPLVFGVVFIVSGLAFKLTAAPFHMWTPDVYEGAPTTVTLIIAAAPKLAAFVIALRVVTDALHGIAIDWQPMLMVLAVLSLLVGNLTALVQTNFKRLLAYSTISHMGFVFLGLLSGVDVAIAEDPNSLAAMIQRMLGYDYAVAAYAYGAALYYVIIYVLTTLITFGIILVLSRKGFECENISDFRGLNRRHPLLAFFLLLSMFSLAGIPPLAGFYAKLSILESLIHAGHLGLAVYAVIMSLIGAFYYIRVVKVAYFEEPDTETPSSPVGLGLITKWVLGINGLLLIVLGIVPGGLMDISIRAVQSSLNFF